MRGTKVAGTDAEPVLLRREDSLSFRSADGETAALRLAPDTDHMVVGRAAVAYVIVDGPRLTFLSA